MTIPTAMRTGRIQSSDVTGATFELEFEETATVGGVQSTPEVLLTVPSVALFVDVMGG